MTRPHPFLASLFSLGSLLAFSLPIFAAETSPPAKVDAAGIKQLIDELGADEFSAREAATEKLAQVGLPAYKAVEEAVQHPDREVRYRAERVLARIRQSDLQRRLDAFQRGGEDSDDYQLPGWSRFKKSFGDTQHTRGVFVDFIKADPELLQTLETNLRGVGEVVANRVTQYQQLMQHFGGSNSLQLNFGQIGVLVFVAGEEGISLNVNQLNMVFNFCSQPGLADAVQNGSRGGVPRELLARLIINSEDWAAYTAMNLGRRFNMKEALIPAKKILTANRQPHMASMAMMTIASIGDESHEPIIEKLLTDTNLVTQTQEANKVIRKVEVRDSALAAMLFLTKQELKDYYTIPAGQPVTDPQMVLTNARIIGFTDEAQRTAVFKKWSEWRAKNPSKAKPVAEEITETPKPDAPKADAPKIDAEKKDPNAK